MTERNVILSVECNLCGKTYAVYVTEESYNEYCSPNRRYVQDIFPYLSADERELLISHTCSECWNKMFGSDEDEEVTEELLTDEEFEAKHGLDCEEFNRIIVDNDDYDESEFKEITGCPRPLPRGCTFTKVVKS